MVYGRCVSQSLPSSLFSSQVSDFMPTRQEVALALCGRSPAHRTVGGGVLGAGCAAAGGVSSASGVLVGVKALESGMQGVRR